MSIFKDAAKKQLRFDTQNGQLTVEDLWSFPLERLNTLAVAIHGRIQTRGAISFLNTKTDPNAEDNLRLDILKAVIADKQEEKEAARNKQLKIQQLARLKELQEEDRDKALKEMSPEERAKAIEELENSF